MMKYLTKKSLTFISIFLFLSFCIFADTSYKVNKGDTLYSIASGLNTTVDELKKANNLTSNMISIGQKLIVPNELETIYTVKPGDNLYQIARKFNTTVDKLITLNNLKNTTLSVGQILIVREVS